MKFPFLDKKGSETLDPKPMAIPIRFQQITEADKLRKMVHGILSEHAQSMGGETFEESLDFDIDDDPFPHSSFEVDFVNEARIDAFERAIRSGQFEEESPALPNAALSGGAGDSNNAAGNNAQPVPARDGDGSAGGS